MNIALFCSTFIILTSANVSYADTLYQRLNDGSIWGHTGTPCNAAAAGTFVRVGRSSMRMAGS